jgi:hypothetical protein
MAIDYALAKRLCTKHKAALTRARKQGPQAVLVAVQAFYDEFDHNDLPLPDDWHRWNIAQRDAEMALRMEGLT